MFGHKWFGQDWKFYDDGEGGGGGEVAPSQADIISEAAGAVDSGGSDGLGVEASAPKPKAEATPEPTDEEKAEEAEVEKIRQELRAKNTKLVGKIEVDRHQAVLTRNRNKWEEERKKLQAEFDKKLEKYKPYEDPEVQAALRAMQLADEDPATFVKLIMNDERYAGLITLKEAQQIQQQVASQRPKPNARQGDTEYYDNEGLAALLDFERKRAVEEAKEVLMKEFGPIKQNFEQTAQWNQRVEQNRRILENARQNWRGFRENERAIQQALKDNESWDLNDAYREVVLNKNTATEAELRKKILEEMKVKPSVAAGSERGAAPERKGENGPRSTTSIIEEAMREAGLA